MAGTWMASGVGESMRDSTNLLGAHAARALHAPEARHCKAHVASQPHRAHARQDVEGFNALLRN